MKVLLLSRYGPLGASSRVRSYQYLPYLKAHGIDVIVLPLLNDAYVKAIYSGKSKPLFSIVTSYIQRVTSILNTRHFDLIWIEKEIFPWMPALAEIMLVHFGIPYIVDYDDAIFHRYDLTPNRAVRILFGSKIRKVMRCSSAVIVGNEYLAKYANLAGAKRVEYISTVIDLDRYSIRNCTNVSGFNVGWIGSPMTVKYLNSIKPSINHFLKDGNSSLSLVGSGNVELGELPVKIISWSEETEVANIQDFDIGIMPLPDSPWERGKCGYKLIQYMACGKPVIASPVGVNIEIVKHGVNGFLAESTEDWLAALTSLRDDPDLREKMGTEGRKIVERKYCLQVTAPKLVSIIQSVKEDSN